jgi:type IV secretory pathway VirB4 component
MEARLLQDLATIEQSTLQAAEARKQTAELLVNISHQLQHPMDVAAKRAELQEELDDLVLRVANEKVVYGQVLGNLKTIEESTSALRKKCSDADALLEKKMLQVGTKSCCFFFHGFVAYS